MCTGMIEQLKDLKSLEECGALTTEQFEEQKLLCTVHKAWFSLATQA